MVTKTSQDVPLDDMAIKVIEWVDKWKLINPIDDEDEPYALEKHDLNIFYKLEELHTSLDVVRKVEEGVIEEYMHEYIANLWELGGFEEKGYDYRSAGCHKFLLQADPETRLRAIYKTLKEAGKI